MTRIYTYAPPHVHIYTYSPPSIHIYTYCAISPRSYADRNRGHGKYAGDGTILEIALNEVIPMLYVRLEDLAAVGIASWEALAQIEAARLI